MLNVAERYLFSWRNNFVIDSFALVAFTLELKVYLPCASNVYLFVVFAFIGKVSEVS